jgi:recombination protein RecA
MFGPSETTTGGNALKFYASVRLDVRRIATIKAGDEKLGSRTRVKVVKNKCAPPFTEAEFEIRWGAGIDAASELLDLGLARGVIDKSGAHFSFAGQQLGHGRERVREALLSDAKTMAALREAVMAAGPVKPGRAEADA